MLNIVGNFRLKLFVVGTWSIEDNFRLV